MNMWFRVIFFAWVMGVEPHTRAPWLRTCFNVCLESKQLLKSGRGAWLWPKIIQVQITKLYKRINRDQLMGQGKFGFLMICCVIWDIFPRVQSITWLFHHCWLQFSLNKLYCTQFLLRFWIKVRGKTIWYPFSLKHWDMSSCPPICSRPWSQYILYRTEKSGKCLKL